MGEDDEGDIFVGPGGKCDDLFEGVAAHDDDVNGAYKCLISTIFTWGDGLVSALKPVDAAVGAGDKAVEAGGDKDGCFDGHGGSWLRLWCSVHGG